MKVEIIVADGLVDMVVATIRKVARTDQKGDCRAGYTSSLSLKQFRPATFLASPMVVWNTSLSASVDFITCLFQSANSG